MEKGTAGLEKTGQRVIASNIRENSSLTLFFFERE
jgi:hypothetical protein